jgi:hypothetical protein
VGAIDVVNLEYIMKKRVQSVCAAVVLAFFGSNALATTQYVTGRVVFSQGHVNPACRTVEVQDSSGAQYFFRLALPSSGPDSILAVILTAQAAGMSVTVAYDTTITTGCGTEPEVLYVSANS